MSPIESKLAVTVGRLVTVCLILHYHVSENTEESRVELLKVLELTVFDSLGKTIEQVINQGTEEVI